MSLIFRRNLSTCMKLFQSTGKPINRFQTLYGNKSSPKSQGNQKRTKRMINGNKNHHHHHQQQQQRSERIIDPRKFEFKEGSETSKSAISSLISKIYYQSSNFMVEQVGESGLIKIHLSKILENLNLSKQGIQLIDRPKSDDDEGGRLLPLIKIVPIQEMNSWYNDLLAKSKQIELLEIGSVKTLKTLEIKLKQEQKKSATKEFQLKWSISINDLKNQKKLEIQKIIQNSKTQKSFLINVVYNKSNPGRLIDTIFKDEEDLEIEFKKRELLKKILEEEILNDLDCKWSVEGDLKTKLVYQVTPKQIQQETNKSVDKEEQPKKEKKKKQLHTQAKPKSKTSEEDLDDLYLFKIED